MSLTIDKKQVLLPVITFSYEAWKQLQLMLEHDFTLKGKWLRILISGKGCEGFKYSIGFNDLQNDDLQVPVQLQDPSEKVDYLIAIDAFTAFYLPIATIDYMQDEHHDGFLVTNHLQQKYEGKFWRENPSMIPPTVKNDSPV